MPEKQLNEMKQQKENESLSLDSSEKSKMRVVYPVYPSQSQPIAEKYPESSKPNSTKKVIKLEKEEEGVDVTNENDVQNTSSYSTSDLSSYYNYDTPLSSELGEELSSRVDSKSSLSSSPVNSDFKYCQHCGEKIYKDAVICVHCGRQVSTIIPTIPMQCNPQQAIMQDRMQQLTSPTLTGTALGSLKKMFSNLKQTHTKAKMINRLQRKMRRDEMQLQKKIMVSDKKAGRVFMLAFLGFLGIGGLERFYTGDILNGILGFVFTPYGYILSMVDMIRVLTHTYTDSSHKYVIDAPIPLSEDEYKQLEQQYLKEKEADMKLLYTLMQADDTNNS